MRYKPFLVGMIGLVFIFMGCQTTSPAATPTLYTSYATIPAATPTNTVPSIIIITLTPSVAPQVTVQPTTTPDRVATALARPSRTPQPTKTPGLLPDSYMTPQAPEGEASQYQLRPWTADKAHGLTTFMEEYRQEAGVHFWYSPTMEQYYSLALMPAMAYQEALLRYPADGRAHQWQLGALANQAIGNSLGASDQPYQTYLVESLNKGEVTLDPADLNTWFSAYAPGGKIWVDELTPFAPYLNSVVVSIANEIGGTSFWVLESEAGFETIPLFNELGNLTIVSGHRTQLADVTQDGTAELIITFYSHSGSIRMSSTQIYDLSQLPPQQVKWGPGLWTALESIGPDGRVTKVGDEPIGCLNGFKSEYLWNGQWLEQVAVEVFGQELDCLFFLDFSSLTLLERQEFLRAYETNVGDVQPRGIDFYTGEPYAPDAQDKVRWQLALGYLVLGDEAKTRDYLNRIVQTPAVPESSWVQPAQAFLAEYQTVEDGYQACLAAGELCANWLDILFLQLSAQIPLDQAGRVVEWLTEQGVPVAEQGAFDMDQNGTAEQWFTVRTRPDVPLELWVVLPSATAVKVDLVDDYLEQPPVFAPYPGDKLPQAFTVGSDHAYELTQNSNQEPVIITHYWPDRPGDYTPLWQRQYGAEIESLLAGADPAGVLEQLLAAAENPAFENSHEYEYFLGLTYELLGEEDKAVEAYFKAWQNCCDTVIFGPNGSHEAQKIIYVNGLSLMAQAKLEKRP